MTSSSSTYEIIIRKPYKVMLIIAFVLGVFYPTIFSDISLLDDVDMVNSLFNVNKFDIWGLFFPKNHQGGYYRPLIIGSYLFDTFAWGLESKIMHFENILLHLVNALLVFWLASLLIRERSGRNRFIPLAASLLFALNPIVTESVNWISGRTDVLAGVFVLLSAVCIVHYRTKHSLVLLCGAGVCIFIGLLAKETALGFIPAALILLVCKDTTCAGEGRETPFISSRDLIHFLLFTSMALVSVFYFYSYWLVIGIGVAYLGMLNRDYVRANSLRKICSDNLLKILILLGAVLSCAGLFLMIRSLAFSSNISKIGQTIKLMLQDLNYTLIVFSGAAGFYVKKFFLPLPLNLAIREIDPLYELLGILIFFICIYLVHRRRLYGGLFLAGCCMLVPALPFAFGTIAWTAYAERYVYLASPFWILALCVYCAQVNKHVTSLYITRICVGLVWIVIIVSATVNFQRNVVWQENVSIFKDTVEKSPRFKPARGLYMSSLVNVKNYDEAIRQYNVADSLHSIEYEEQYDLLFATILIEQKRYDEAEAVYEKAIVKSRGKKTNVYKAMSNFLEGKKQRVANHDQRMKLDARIIDCYEKIYGLEPTAQNLFALGKKYLAHDETQKALASFSSVLSDKKTDDTLRANAQKLVNSIH